MKFLVTLILMIVVAACGQNEDHSQLNTSHDLDKKNYGLADTDIVAISLDFAKCKNRVWPYMVLKADYKVDMTELAEMSTKEIYRVKQVTPHWQEGGYHAKEFKTFSGLEFVELINDTAKKNFGNKNMGAEAIYIDIFDNNSSFSSVDKSLASNIKIPLPFKLIAGKMFYSFPKEERKKLTDQMKSRTGCRSVKFNFSVVETESR